MAEMAQKKTENDPAQAAAAYGPVVERPEDAQDYLMDGDRFLPRSDGFLVG